MKSRHGREALYTGVYAKERMVRAAAALTIYRYLQFLVGIVGPVGGQRHNRAALVLSEARVRRPARLREGSQTRQSEKMPHPASPDGRGRILCAMVCHPQGDRQCRQTEPGPQSRKASASPSGCGDDVRLPGRLLLQQGLLGDRPHRGPQEDRRADPDPPRRSSRCKQTERQSGMGRSQRRKACPPGTAEQAMKP